MHFKEIELNLLKWREKYQGVDYLNGLDKKTIKCLVDHGLLMNAYDFEVDKMIQFQRNAQLKQASPIDDLDIDN